MNNQYPENIINKILQITLETQTFAYVAVDSKGILIDQGGEVEAMEMPVWRLGDMVLDDLIFLSSNLPMSSAYEYLPSLQVTDSCLLDVHLFQDKEITWVILVNKTDDLEWQRQARQKGNELNLLQQKMDLKQGNFDSDIKSFEFFEALSMMAMRRVENGSFQLLKPLSQVFSGVYPEAFESDKLLDPQNKFPFVENFLIDAQQVWSSPTDITHKRSGPWIEKLENGEELALEAIALNWDNCNLLFIELLEEGYVQNHEFLQMGREAVLLKSVLEKEVRKRTQEIRDREEEIALRLVAAADTRDDGETGSHIRRLGLYSELMARHLGWNQNEIDEIRIAAPMHDIGKIGIPDHILRKPGKLTKKEFEIMRSHSEIGAKILSNSKSELVQMARDISLGHHEKWDGSGYPQGLSGEDISMSARIVAIVDVFDALIHKRVYKNEMTIDDALKIMQDGRGKHFDPQLLDLFISLREEMAQIAFDYVDPLNGEMTKLS